MLFDHIDKEGTDKPLYADNSCLCVSKNPIRPQAPIEEGPTPVMFPLLHHMSSWLPQWSRRSQPAGRVGAAGANMVFCLRCLSFLLWHVIFFPFPAATRSHYVRISVSPTSGSLFLGQAEIEASTSGGVVVVVVFKTLWPLLSHSYVCGVQEWKAEKVPSTLWDSED